MAEIGPVLRQIAERDPSDKLFGERRVKTVVDMPLHYRAQINHFSFALGEAHLFHLSELGDGPWLFLFFCCYSLMLLLVSTALGDAVTGKVSHGLVEEHGPFIDEVSQHDVLCLIRLEAQKLVQLFHCYSWL